MLRAIESAGLVPGRDAAISLDIAASQFGSSRQRTAWPRRAVARQRRADRTARRVDRAVPDRFHRGSSRRGRCRGLPALHRRVREQGPGDRRRPPGDECGAGAPGGRRAAMHRGADQAEPGRHDHRNAGRARRRAREPAWRRSSPRDRARPRTSPSFTWRWAGRRRSSKWAPFPVRSAWRSGTRRSASKRRSAPQPRWRRIRIFGERIASISR